MEIFNGHHQVISSYPLNEVHPGIGCPKPSGHLSQELKERPQAHPPEPLRCPRCDSNHTKFCYYNNYSLSQPRYFCKSCRRYWTKGGTLRNVPVGGGCRKNKRSSSSSSSCSSTSSSSKILTLPQGHHDSFTTHPIPTLSYDPGDLSLTFSSLQNDAFLLVNSNCSPSSSIPTGHGFLDILKGGLMVPTEPTPAVGGFQSLYYEFGVGSEEVDGGGNGVMLPFNHGVNVSNSTMADAANASASTSTSHDSYWNGAGSTSWHGLINGFPHEIHDGA